MNYIVITLGVLAGSLTLIHRAMVKKIYETDGTALSTFALPTAIRREYKRRFGVDVLYRAASLFPIFVAIVVLLGWYTVFFRR